jgi:hypothetical protein
MVATELASSGMGVHCDCSISERKIIKKKRSKEGSKIIRFEPK